MIFTADPINSPQAQTAPPAEMTATLRAVTYLSRAEVVPLLAEAFEDCGCWPRSRSGSVNYLCLRLELPLGAVAELYPSLVECGLDFDKGGHRDLAMLCMLQRHAPSLEVRSRTLNLRLDLTFAEETEPKAPGAGAVAMA